jgi:hypothetical protein
MPGDEMETTTPVREALAEPGIWTPELQRAHADLSALDLRFREHALRTPELLEGRSFADLVFLGQPWPTFLGPAKVDELRRVSLGACNLLRSVPGRYYRCAPARAVAAYDLASAAQLDLLLSPPNGSDTAASRGDFIATPQGFKCIEFNFSPNLGGWEAVLLANTLRQTPAIADFLAAQPEKLDFTDTVAVFFRSLLATLSPEVLAKGTVNVAFAIAPKDSDDFYFAPGVDLMKRSLRAAAAALDERLTAAVHFCRYQELIPLRERVYFGKTQIHAIVELDTRGTPAPLYRSFKRGEVVIFNGPLSPLMSNKRTLALAWELAAAGQVSDEERRLLHENFPWTRHVAPGQIDFRGEAVDCAELLSRESRSLVLKQVESYGGKGVWLGRHSPAAEWDELARRALAEGEWVVQEVVDFVPYLYQCGALGCEVHEVIWGPFFFGQTYGGTILRMQPRSVGGPVNLSRTATEGIIFEVQPGLDSAG